MQREGGDNILIFSSNSRGEENQQLKCFSRVTYDKMKAISEGNIRLKIICAYILIFIQTTHPIKCFHFKSAEKNDFILTIVSSLIFRRRTNTKRKSEIICRLIRIIKWQNLSINYAQNRKSQFISGWEKEKKKKNFKTHQYWSKVSSAQPINVQKYFNPSKMNEQKSLNRLMQKLRVLVLNAAAYVHADLSERNCPI